MAGDGQSAGSRYGAILEHVSLPEAVTRALRHRILNNELPAGSRLTEASLAAEFGVSRSTIRDAMRSLQVERLIEAVPRHSSVVTRMSTDDAEDVCYARYVLEIASLDRGFGPSPADLVRELRLALERMFVAARLHDLDALVESDTQFHEALIDVSGRRRLKDLWFVLNSQMGAVMRIGLERQGIEMTETVQQHVSLAGAVSDGDLPRLRAELRSHYLGSSPRRGISPSGQLDRDGQAGSGW